jgi:hypothetical protein
MIILDPLSWRGLQPIDEFLGRDVEYVGKDPQGRRARTVVQVVYDPRW